MHAVLLLVELDDAKGRERSGVQAPTRVVDHEQDVVDDDMTIGHGTTLGTDVDAGLPHSS